MTTPSRTLWVDARAGVAGDMFLAALLDAGAGLDAVRRDVAAVLGGAVSLETGEVNRGTMRATALTVRLVEPDQPHRPWHEVAHLIEAADLPERVRRSALHVFEELAAAEARVHGVAVDDVHFHEVGAWDSIADVVGVCSALDDLDVARVIASEITVGDGHARTAHGSMPVPVPAVLQLLAGSDAVARARPVDLAPERDTVGELATPTGVALLVALGEPGPTGLPAGVVDAVGVGAGRRDDLPWPNIVRVALSPPSRDVATPESAAGRVSARPLEELAANVDDLDPRLWPSVVDALLTAGARDAWLTPIHMKKGRPAFTISALVDPQDASAVRRALFSTTTTFGVRSHAVDRVELDRCHVPVEVALEGRRARIAIKVGSEQGRIVRATPEYEEVVAVAAAWGRSVADVLAAAVAAAAAAGLVPGSDLPGLPGARS